MIQEQQKKVLLDAGPVINLTLNNLLWVLPRLKHIAKVQFYITEGVRQELIDRPLQTKKYKLEALQILPYIVDGTIQIIHGDDIEEKAKELDTLINSTMTAKDNPIKLVHRGEVTAIAAYLLHNMDAFALDERTTRYLIETPSNVKKRMQRKLRTTVYVNKHKMQIIKKQLKSIRCIRSVELIAASYKLGLFCHFEYQTPEYKVDNISDSLLEGLLWALKLNGCAITEEEVKEMYQIIRSIKPPCRLP